MKKIILLSLSCFFATLTLRAQTPWTQFALALDSNTHVMQLNVALDSLGFTLAAPGQATDTWTPALSTSTNASPWTPMDITALDSSAVAVLTWHKFGPMNDIIVALDSAGNQSYYHHDIGGGLVALDSIWLSSFQVHNFLALDSLTFAAGMNASNTHPTIITSVDSGATWSVMGSSMPFALDSGFTSLAGNGSTMAVMALDSLLGNSLFLTSPDYGATWNAPSSTFPGLFDVLGLALDSANNMYACGRDITGGGIRKSTDGGATWLPMDITGIDLDSAITAIAVVGGRLVAAGLDSLGRSQVYGMMLSTSTDPRAAGLSSEIWPNPAQQEISIRIADATQGAWTLSVTDMQGKTLRSVVTSGSALQQGEQLNLSGLSDGLYTISATDGVHRMSTRVVVRK